ncbi:MAG TPA: hypothetical protein VEV17_03820 [Bryobacteraceae bacterium]|nr:hypothetical protein [Bryobacteraceae bacterium]
MKNRSRVIIMTAILLIGVMLWLPGLRSQRVAAQSAGLTGSYGFNLTVVPVAGGAASFLGVVTFDGAGNATASFTIAQNDPNPSATTLQVQTGGQNSGTYTVNADGTGTMTFPGNGGAPTTVAFVITDGGSGLMLLPTGGFGNNLLTGTARKQ